MTVLAVVACSGEKFASTTGAGLDGGAGADAQGGDAEGGEPAGADASVVEAGAPSCDTPGTAVVLCASFDGLDPLAGWSNLAVGGGDPPTIDTVAVSPPGSLLAHVPRVTVIARSAVSHAFAGTGLHVIASANVQLDKSAWQPGDNNARVFDLHAGGAGIDFYVDPNGTTVATLKAAGGYDTYDSVPLPTGVWLRVEVEVDFGSGTWAVRAGPLGANPPKITSGSGYAFGTVARDVVMTTDVGVIVNNPPAAEIRIRYDDVVVTRQ